MSQAAAFQITCGYGQQPNYPLNNGFHNGEDRIMPVGTPVLVNGCQIGLSGNTGFVDPAPTAAHPNLGEHLHVGKFTVNGTVMPPQGRGFSFNSARVVTVSSDATNGNWIRVLGDGYYYVYLHLSQQTCRVGDVLVPQPVVQAPQVPYSLQGETMISNVDNEYWRWNKLFMQIRGRNASRDEFVASAVGKTWLNAMEILSDDAEADAATNAQATGQTALRDAWSSQIYALQDQLKAVNAQLAQTQIDDQKDKQALQDALNRLNVQSAKLSASVVVVAPVKPEGTSTWKNVTPLPKPSFIDVLKQLFAKS